MKSLNRIIYEQKIKNTSLDILFLLVVFIFAWLFNKWLEMLIFVFSFTFIRLEFTKAVHGSDFTKSAYKGIKYCRYITFGIQIVSLIFIININISKYFNILLSALLGLINFFAKDYLEYRMNKIVFYKGMKEEELPNGLIGVERDIMLMYYVKRYKLDKIALKVGYSVDNVKKLKSKIIKRYS